jgi:hypothetical protein
MEELDDSTKATLWVIGALEELRRLKLVDSDGSLFLTPKGIASWDQLDAQWKPSVFMILMVMNTLGCLNERLYKLLLLFRDDREKVLKKCDELEKRKDKNE